MNNDHYQEQDGEDGEMEDGAEQDVLVLIKDQAQLIRDLIDNQGQQASINERTIAILKELDARIERLEQNM